MTHAIAALEGHDGAARRDERARRLAARLCESPPFRPRRDGGPTRHADPRSESQLHAPGWVSNIARARTAPAHHRSTRRSRAPSTTRGARASSSTCRRRLVARMVACVRSVAYSPFFRYPNIRLNQINFAAELQACAASMTGDPTLLRRDYRRQLARFLRRREARRAAVAHPQPRARATASTATRSSAPAHRQNIESTEYANIVLDVIYYYEQARRAG